MASREVVRRRVLAKSFGGMDSERIFISTSSLVPEDRRGSSRGSWTVLRKPHRGGVPSNGMLASRLGTPMQEQPAVSKAFCAPGEGAGGAEVGRVQKDERRSEVKWRYDPMLHSWFEVQRPQTAPQQHLGPGQAPEKVTLEQYRTNFSLRSHAVDDLLPGKRTKGLKVTFNPALIQEAQFTEEGAWPSQRDLVERQEWHPESTGSMAAPPAAGLEFEVQVANGEWQAFRSPKPPAFRVPLIRTVIKDAIGRDVTHIMSETPQNLLVTTNALYHSSAPFIEAERPLSARSPRANRKTEAKPPPLKGRRNCSSQEFLGSMSHDFVPVHNQGSPRGPIPSTNGTGYALWSGASSTAERIMPTQVQMLPTKAYGGHMHPGLYEEEIQKWQGPVDTLRLRKANVDCLGMIANYRPLSSYR